MMDLLKSLYSFALKIPDQFQKRATAYNKALRLTAVLVLLSLCSTFLFIHYSTRSMGDNIRHSLQQSVQQQTLNINFHLDNLLQADESLMPILYPYSCSSVDRLGQYEEFEFLNSILPLYSRNDYISNVRVYMPDSKSYSHQGSTFFPLSTLTKSEDAETLPYLQRSGIFWLETNEIQSYDLANGTSVTKQVLTLAHSMRHSANFERIACVLMLDIEISDLHKLLNTDADADQYGYLINSQGTCLASVDEGDLHRQVISDKAVAQIQKLNSGFLEERNRLYVFQKLDATDWYILMDYPASILAMADRTQGRILLVLMVTVLLIVSTMTFILAYNYSTNVTLSRINALLYNSTADVKVELKDAPEFLDPLHQLERNADRMVYAVQDMTEKRYLDRLAVAESEMKSLQAQIKPHFLYNTLDVIKWLILGQKDTDAIWMVNSLSKYLRQSINKGPSIIPLQEELNLSRTYLSIMQKRFDNRFQVQFEIEEGSEAYMIPKLTLQPLLENALLHGILYCDKPEKELTIRAWVTDRNVHIEVEDNGNGMSEELCNALREGTVGYGFSNVRKRLSLFSHGQGDFQVFSREGVGTCIAIKFPADTTPRAPSL